MAGGEKMIEIQNLTKRYGQIKAVNNLNFTVEKGEILGFLGPNGAGKSTTMNIITGYIPSLKALSRYADTTSGVAQGSQEAHRLSP
jgi:ABC-2 type transport system ATP-binding protein